MKRFVYLLTLMLCSLLYSEYVLAQELEGLTEIKKIAAWESYKDSSAFEKCISDYNTLLELCRAAVAKKSTTYQKHEALFNFLHSNSFQMQSDRSNLSQLLSDKSYNFFTATILYICICTDLNIPIQFYHGEEYSVLAIPINADELAFINLMQHKDGFGYKLDEDDIKGMVEEKKITSQIAESYKPHTIFLKYVAVNAKEKSLHELSAQYIKNSLESMATGKQWEAIFESGIRALNRYHDDEIFNLTKTAGLIILEMYKSVPFKMESIFENILRFEPWNSETEEYKYQVLFYCLINIVNCERMEHALRLESQIPQKRLFTNQSNNQVNQVYNQYLSEKIEYFGKQYIFDQVIELLNQQYLLNDKDAALINAYKIKMMLICQAITGTQVNKANVALENMYKLYNQFPKDEKVNQVFFELEVWYSSTDREGLSPEVLDSLTNYYKDRFSSDSRDSVTRYMYIITLYTSAMKDVRDREEARALRKLKEANKTFPEEKKFLEAIKMVEELIKIQKKYKIKKTN